MAAPVNDRHVGTCGVHGKRLYRTRADAKAVIRRLPDRGGMRAYKCTEVADHFHLGHLPQATLLGLKTADEVYGRGEVA